MNEKTLSTIERIAKAEARRDTILNWEDVYQESVAKFIGNRFRAYPDEDVPYSYLKAVVKNTAFDMRTKELHARCQYTYTVSTVRRILETMHVEIPDMVHPETMDVIAMRSDIRTCMKELPEEMQQSILDRYVIGVIPSNGSAGRKALNRAVDRLTDTMNYYQGGTQFIGTRKIISNAHARAITSED